VKLPHGYFPGSIERNAEASPTIDTGVGNWHTLIGEETYNGREIDNSKVGTICTNSGDRQACVFWVQNSDMRVRKLTPRECFRLMGVKDEDYERVAENQSKSSLYHLAGDSIVVNVLIAIFKELFM
jgi:DNA (cytosine-5)-methyltransferase 1